MNLTIRHYCESKVLNQNISTKHDMIYSYNAVYQIPRPRDIEGKRVERTLPGQLYVKKGKKFIAR